MIFKDRPYAGRVLARALAKYKLDPKKTVIVGIPRGGVVVAFEVSKLLKIPMDIIVIKKLGAPENRELAIGATASFGLPSLDRWLIADLGISSEYLKKEIIRKRREAKSLENELGVTFDEKRFLGKTVILVDDGLATGQTVRAAGRLLREMGSSKIILAVPCASEDVIEQVKDIFEDVLSLEIRSDFSAVGQFYKDFDQVSTGDVKELLERAK